MLRRMRYLSRVMFPVLSVLLTACAGVPPAQLAQDADQITLLVEASPSGAYRKVVEGARTCYERVFTVAADYFPDESSGRVSASMKTAFTMGTAFVVDISPAAKGASVRVVSHRSATAMPSNVSKWLVSDYTACELR